MLNKIDLFNAKNAGTPIEAGLVMDVVAVGTFPDKNMTVLIKPPSTRTRTDTM